ncbi:MAG: TRAP transporter large permease subunit, partial [Pseudomonadota bacterium]|nr:TRAP transporter large permease subunit [Pseudomonadota bacterium]
LPVFISLDVLTWLKSLELGAGGSLVFQFIALALTMMLAVVLGMGMPAVPAYINVALLMGPVLAGLGIAVFTAHMFIFYFAVASAITPPVALAAFAAASITKEDPMMTGVAAVRIGIVMFVIPFVFAFYPDILLIEAAFIDPTVTGTRAYLPGYDGTVDLGALALLILRLLLALVLLASALSRFDRARLALWEVGARLTLAAMLLAGDVLVYGGAAAAGIGLLAWHRVTTRSAATQPAGG